jgi:hypothetical protein
MRRSNDPEPPTFAMRALIVRTLPLLVGLAVAIAAPSPFNLSLSPSNLRSEPWHAFASGS